MTSTFSFTDPPSFQTARQQPYFSPHPSHTSFSTPKFTQQSQPRSESHINPGINNFNSPVDRFNRTSVGPSNLRYSVTNHEETPHPQESNFAPNSKFTSVNKSQKNTHFPASTARKPSGQNIFSRNNTNLNRPVSGNNGPDRSTPLPAHTYNPGAGHPGVGGDFRRSTSKVNNVSDFEVNALQESLRRRLDSDLNDDTMLASQATKNFDVQMLSLLNRLEAASRESDEQNIMLKHLSNDLSILEAQRPELDSHINKLYQDIERQTLRRR